MMPRPRQVLIVLGGLAIAAWLFVWSGAYNVSARAGHLAPTAKLLHYAMRKSARTHALGVDVPPLSDSRMIVRGAAWYAVGCAGCHGAPGDPYPPIVGNMTPAAPRLEPLIDTWRDRELFWIVDNGIKYTGMPAWAAAERPDEVWSMVAFLRRLPTLDAASYRRLASEPGAGARSGITRPGIDARFDNALAQCARCHGYDGMGHGTGAFPLLAGQKQPYLYETLKAYARGERRSGFMQPAAAALEDRALSELAHWYAAARGRPPPRPEANTARGGEIARNGLPEQRVPACRHCHGPGAVADNPRFPRLAGQNPDYLARQLELWRDGRRGGSAYKALMTRIAEGLGDEDIRDLAAWYAGLPYFGTEAERR